MTADYRPEFEAALRMFAQASGRMVALGFEAPILVGGGSVEFFSASALTTGDFDIATARQDEFESTLRDLGFVKPSGPGRATRGWIHPDLALGFEVVARTLLGGLADRERVFLADFGADGVAKSSRSRTSLRTGWDSSHQGLLPKCVSKPHCCCGFTATWISPT